jgi:hypothetical protein
MQILHYQRKKLSLSEALKWQKYSSETYSMAKVWLTDWFYLKKVYSDFKVIGVLLPIRILVKFNQTKLK